MLVLLVILNNVVLYAVSYLTEISCTLHTEREPTAATPFI
jgi:hypothetical protein